MERRDFYRIEDSVHLVKTPIEKHLLSDDPYQEQYGLPREVLLVNQLQSLDNDSRDLLRQVGDSNRALGSYLRYLEQKVELLARYVVSHDRRLSQWETVSLSEGGISFYQGQTLRPDSYLHLVLVLFPGYTTIAALAQVKSCEKVAEQPDIYRVGTEFEVLLEADRKQIVRHLRRLQSREIREQSQGSDENN